MRRKLKGLIKSSKEPETPTGSVDSVAGLVSLGLNDDAGPSDRVKSVTDRAHQAMSSLRFLGGHTEGVIEGVESVTGAVGRTYRLWKPLMDKVQVFADLIEKLEDIHPYAKLASTALLAGFKIVTSQANRDKDAEKLLRAMDDLYAFVIRAKDLSDVDDDRRKLFEIMLLQTIQCAYFIQDLAKVRNFWRRAASNVFSGTQLDSKINEFTESFRDIRRCFTQRGVLEGEIRLLKILNISTDIQSTLDLFGLAYIREAGLDQSKGCIPGTRAKTIEELLSWANAPDAPKVRFLLGGAGTGKSSIAHSVGGYFDTLRRLGSFFRFDRSSQNDRPLNRVIRTIAHNLANWDPTFRRALASVIHARRDLAEAVDIRKQWQGLIIEPLKKVALVGPVLIVIDAFDECSSIDAPERRLLLKLLIEGSKELPSNFRIIITSRPEKDVLNLVSSIGKVQPYVSCMDLEDYKEEARLDIIRYVRQELTPDNPNEGPLVEEDIELVAGRAEGLFQWAATACRAIREKSDGLTLKERLGLVLQEGPSSLDDLYRSVLEGLFKSENETVMKRFNSVMAQILCSSSPLSVESLEEMRHLATGAFDEIYLIVRGMGSLLSGVHTTSSPIRPHHTSFRDFLTDEQRSRQWFVNLGAGHPVMALACLRVINERLAFNMCSLETSSVLNRDIVDLEHRISTSVSQSLIYAVCSWKDHLPSTALPLDMQQELNRFLQAKLLFWFELLSLLKCLNRAAPSLEAALRIYDHSRGESCKALLSDAIAFIRCFASVIALSATHVYLSALPFAPTSSTVRANFAPLFPNVPFVEGTHDLWPQTRAVLSSHNGSITSVAFSPDGRYIASGAYEFTVLIWDVETCETLHKLRCPSWVNGVIFSPDSSRIAAACKDSMVRVWETMTGDVVCKLTQGHESRCIAYSLDGGYIVSGDVSGCICLWSTKTNQMVHQNSHGGKMVFSVAFSPEGRFIVSGGADCMVRVWDTSNGQPVGTPLQGHTNWVRSVLVSQDGLRIISGSSDLTIRIWNLETQQMLHTITHPFLKAVLSLSLSPDSTRAVSGCTSGSALVWDLKTRTMVGQPLVGHSEFVTSVSFSPDGRHIVSGSLDVTMRIWSVEENMASSSRIVETSATAFASSADGRHIVSGHFVGSVYLWDVATGECIHRNSHAHMRRVNCVRFSPDGSRFTSASNDRTLRVWSSATLQPLGESLRGHTDTVLDVDYSPSGDRIVSCSSDGTLRIWDANTHECLLEPLVGHSSEINSVSWSPDGKHIASGSDDRTIRVWDAATGSAVGEPFDSREESIRSVSWSDSGRYVMSTSSEGAFILWDIQNGAAAGPSQALRCHEDDVYCWKFSPDRRRIVSAGKDGTLRLWDTQTREQVGMPLRHPFQWCCDLTFSPDGRLIISLCSGGSIVVWDVNDFLEPPKITHPSFKNLDNVMATPNLSDFSSKAWDGWIRDVTGGLVMWVPDEYREAVWWYGMKTVMGGKRFTIDFTDACYGTEWKKCYQG